MTKEKYVMENEMKIEFIDERQRSYRNNENSVNQKV